MLSLAAGVSEGSSPWEEGLYPPVWGTSQGVPALLLALGASAPSTHPFRGGATSYLDLGSQRVAGELKPDLVIPLKHTTGDFRSHRIRTG